MMLASLLAAESASRTTFEWGRIQSNSDWVLPVVACVAILMFVRWLYRRDSVELRPMLGWLLTALRTATFLGLLILFLQPQWRTEREEVRNSRVLVLADASLSMAIADGESSPSAGAPSRSQQVVTALNDTDFLARLRAVHDVVVFSFSDDLKAAEAVTLQKKSPDDGSDQAAQPTSPKADDAAKPDWAKLLNATGVETRLGQALWQLIQKERGSPISGVIVLSDGGQNAGVSPDAAVALAQEAKIPIFTVGLGSDRQPASVGISDFAVPARAYPGDRYSVTGYIQAQGMAGATATVQLLGRPAAESGEDARRGGGDVLETRQVTLGADGEVLPVKFELTPEAAGRSTLCIRIQPMPGDGNPADNLREADIEIVARKNHVLLFAGGPTRDYQFLRSLLYRDHSTAADVLLQSGGSGISQEATKILDEFPRTREEMFDYDCVVAFDPNWQALDAGQIELLEAWVGEQGGGLIAVAGAAYAGKGVGGWIHDPAMTRVRNLYPVEFPSALATLQSNVYASKEPWRLEFTREGQEADFLWLGDTATASRLAWGDFPGVYSCCPVRGAKPGATVYTRFADPRMTQGDRQPVYFAGQFYGAGSVFYMGSGEMWRLRTIDDAYFEQFYTKLIRHVSQGRLLRGSRRGVLLVGQDRYLLGNTIEVRAQLTNARLEPLAAPSVPLRIVRPDGSPASAAMRADPSRAGAYVAQFPALQEGTYRLDLPVPESDNERLTRRVQVKAPDLERENPRRNDALLSAIAQNSGGAYYVGLSEAFDARSPRFLGKELKDCTTTAIRTVATDPRWEDAWRRGMMMALCGLLCVEWLIRRLVKLA